LTLLESPKAYQTADDTSEVEYYPEPGYVAALILLVGIGHHDGALSRPEDTGANAEPGTGEHDIAEVLGVVVAQVAGDVDAVADATEGQRPFDTDGVGDGSGKETYHGEGRVEGRVCSVGNL
jgi:hypothetical protein